MCNLSKIKINKFKMRESKSVKASVSCKLTIYLCSELQDLYIKLNLSNLFHYIEVNDQCN